MKTTDSRDALDRKIDALLADRPIKPGADFVQRVLAAAESEEAAERRLKSSPPPLRRAIRFALPLAAVIAVALSLWHFFSLSESAVNDASLAASEVEEIFLLEEALSGLAQMETRHLHSEDLLLTLDTLTYELGS
jgi:hypothetical protein